MSFSFRFRLTVGGLSTGGSSGYSEFSFDVLNKPSEVFALSCVKICTYVDFVLASSS